MIYITTLKVDKKLVKMAKFEREIFDLTRKQLKLFEQNEKHPSLRNHKLSGEKNGFWSISINKSIRMVYYVENNVACFVNIGTHDVVYKMN